MATLFAAGGLIAGVERLRVVDRGTESDRPLTAEGNTMTDKHVDEAKGRVKEAAASLTGDEDLKQEGRTDQLKSSIKDAVDSAIDAAEKLGGKVKDSI
jgi:uncharacterized protein YjbJ (UPF0337 family)